MKHKMQLDEGTTIEEVKVTFPDTPIARFTFDEKTAILVCWDVNEVEGILALDNGIKLKLRQGGKPFKVTFDRVKELLGEHFTDKRGVKRVIPAWEGLKSSFLALPVGEPI